MQPQFSGNNESTTLLIMVNEGDGNSQTQEAQKFVAPQTTTSRREQNLGAVNLGRAKPWLFQIDFQINRKMEFDLLAIPID
jgi:hypothetical protein